MAPSLQDLFEKFTTHHHLTLLHRNGGERLAALVPFLRIGLARREKCLLYFDSAVGEGILSGLREHGIDVGSALAKGSILMTSLAPRRARGSPFDPGAVIGLFRKAALQARAEKYSALRICLDMAFALGTERERARVLEFQGKMHSFLSGTESLALCLYGTEELPPEILLDALRSHTHVVHGGRLLESLYFVHAGADLPEITPAREFEERLELLAERQDQISRIRRQAVRLRRMQDVAIDLLGHAAVPELLRGITEGVISLGYPMCWIGMARPDGSVEPVASWGDRKKYLEETPVRWDDSPLGNGPVGAAIRSGRPAVVRDVLRSRRFAPWREGAVSRGFLSVAAVPLTEGEKPVGALAVYAGARDAFDREAEEELSAFALLASLVLRRAREYRDLSASEDRFRRLFDRIPAACFTVDRKGIIRHWNMHSRKLYGYPPKEAAGQSAAALLAPPGGEEDLANSLSRVLAGESLSHEERQHRDKAGNTIWVLSNAYPYRGASGEVELCISVNVDVTGQVEARRALSESEERFRTVVEEIDVLVVELDPRGRILLFNPAAESVTGYPQAEVAGRDYFSLLIPERDRERAGQTFREAVAGKETEEHASALLTKEGRERTIRWNTKAIRNEDGEIRGVVGLGVDVTERRKMEEEKERLRHSLAQAQKMEAVGSLAGGIAHDYNNLLGAIIGHTSRLRSAMGPDDPNRDTVRKVEEAAERAAELTRQLLGFARGGKYRVETLSLNDVVGDVVSIISRSFDRSIEIRTVLDPALRAVEGDRGQLRHSLLNLCINARDAMTRGGTLTLSTRNTVLSREEAEKYHVGRPGDAVVLVVEDTGEGMTEEVLGRVFQPFFTTRRERGLSGMGLPMVYGIVKNHLGGVHAESAPGKGASFTIYLPATERKEAAGPAPHKEPVPTGTGTILFVDDEPAIREMGEELLAALGYRVLLAVDGEDALRIFADRGREIALVILDIVMPKRGGRETFAALRKMDPGIPVLLSSGYTVEGVAREILDEGANGFIQKPYRMADLARAIRRALDSRLPG